MGWYLTDGPEIGHWVAAQTNGKYHAEYSAAIGLKKHDQTIAGVIYENFNGKSLMVHIAITGRLTPAFLKTIFRYPFVTCDVDKIIAPVSSQNVKSIKLVENMGFTEEARIRDAAPDGDIIMYTLTRNECRFL
jgi:RimJ/RimL family protein N-acetyltransferase